MRVRVMPLPGDRFGLLFDRMGGVPATDWAGMKESTGATFVLASLDDIELDETGAPLSPELADLVEKRLSGGS